MSDLTLDFQPSKPYSTKGTIIIYNDNEPLCCDTLDIANSNKRKLFVKQAAQDFPGISEQDLERIILQEVDKILGNKSKAEQETNVDPVEILNSTSQETKNAAYETLRSENLFEKIACDLSVIGIAGEEELKVTVYVVMTSRLLDKPLSAIIQGASASGKSYIIETVAKLMPAESVIQAHDFSDQALFYLPKGSLVHKVVISGERVNEQHGKDGYIEDSTKAFREMVASGELRKAVTIKGTYGRPKTMQIYQPGPIAYLESSTAANIHDEDATRLLPLVTDETAEQTKRIIEAQRIKAKGQIISGNQKAKIILLHQTMQRLLKPIDVRIPYIDGISLPENKIDTRRTYEQFISAIKTVAVLRQYQKQILVDPKTGKEYIEADGVDYRIVYDLMKKVLARKYSPLNQQSRDLLRKVSEQTDTNFTQKDCEQWCGLSNTTVRRRLSPLVSAGIITVDKDSKPYRYKITNLELAEVADLDLPTPEDIAERIAIMSE